MTFKYNNGWILPFETISFIYLFPNHFEIYTNWQKYNYVKLIKIIQ